MNELIEFILSLISQTFTHKPSIYFSIYNLSQMKGHLSNLKSNAITYIIKVHILFKIHALVLRITVFDKIRKNMYLRKSPHSLLFEPKFKLITLVSFTFNLLSSIQSFENNLSHLWSLTTVTQLIMLN